MNKKRIIIIISTAAVIILLVITFMVYIKINILDSQLAQSKNLMHKMREEVASLSDEKKSMAQENEKLQADAVSYLGINKKLQEEKEKLQKGLEDAQKIIENKEGNLQRMKTRLDEIEKRLSAKREKDVEGLVKEKKILTKKMIGLNSTLKKERALYHYNLGVAYAQAQLYDDAVVEYKKSLEINDDNADAHYNVALIYDTINGDARNAVLHYKRYLELKPNAEDKDEVEASIEKLK